MANCFWGQRWSFVTVESCLWKLENKSSYFCNSWRNLVIIIAITTQGKSRPYLLRVNLLIEICFVTVESCLCKWEKNKNSYFCNSWRNLVEIEMGYIAIIIIAITAQGKSRPYLLRVNLLIEIWWVNSVAKKKKEKKVVQANTTPKN